MTDLENISVINNVNNTNNTNDINNTNDTNNINNKNNKKLLKLEGWTCSNTISIILTLFTLFTVTMILSIGSNINVYHDVIEANSDDIINQKFKFDRYGIKGFNTIHLSIEYDKLFNTLNITDESQYKIPKIIGEFIFNTDFDIPEYIYSTFVFNNKLYGSTIIKKRNNYHIIFTDSIQFNKFDKLDLYFKYTS